ncbi:type II toxin-antitoxin system VapC family toxin [Nocardioides plantarum]|uniref:Ribonuclease VapC n=1 Tax=Nocardioides plantarum TaxID=29299 RepID=A0ABV5KG89_9ACTN|nr:type II toxin-antitoxin system VapC family toxin [Nocardioides plantarum]
MIVDASSVIAILRREPGYGAHRDALGSSERARIAAPTLLEASLVAGPERARELDIVLADVEVVAFDREQALVARDAYARFGKGSGHPARLNFGDCMAYALAMTTGDPLLFKGDDFTHTDVTPALA